MKEIAREFFVRVASICTRLENFVEALAEQDARKIFARNQCIHTFRRFFEAIIDEIARKIFTCNQCSGAFRKLLRDT